MRAALDLKVTDLDRLFWHCRDAWAAACSTHRWLTHWADLSRRHPVTFLQTASRCARGSARWAGASAGTTRTWDPQRRSSAACSHTRSMAHAVPRPSPQGSPPGTPGCPGPAPGYRAPGGQGDQCPSHTASSGARIARSSARNCLLTAMLKLANCWVYIRRSWRASDVHMRGKGWPAAGVARCPTLISLGRGRLCNGDATQLMVDGSASGSIALRMRGVSSSTAASALLEQPWDISATLLKNRSAVVRAPRNSIIVRETTTV